MPKDFSINIDEFSGIHRVIAEKANVNGGNTLEDTEITIFNDILSSYDIKSDTFFFEQVFYDNNNNIVDPVDKLLQPSASTKVQKELSPEDMMIREKNNNAIAKAKEYAKIALANRSKTVTVNKNINGKDVQFTYNIASLENYIINEATDQYGHKIKYFSEIEKIRNKAYFLRTKEECRLLNEFNTMVNSSIKAGVEYGVDPKLIIAIIEQEVCFQGLSDKVIGSFGKGYMQITSTPIADMIGGYTKNKKIYYRDKIKDDIYGPELRELLVSRGFNPDCPPKERSSLKSAIMNYLKENKDADFNIRMGTLILRAYLNKTNGNIQLAAQNYNGNSKNGIKYTYGKHVKNYYTKMLTQENLNQTS